MGKKKANGKRKKSEFDDFFNKGGNEDGWVAGVSAMALDEDVHASLPATAAAGTTGMDIGDTARVQAGRDGSLGVKKVNMKAVRGQRTKAQKLRKTKKAEKATARADKAVVRIDTKVSHKQKKNNLKTIY